MCRAHSTSYLVRHAVPDDSGKAGRHWDGLQWHNVRTNFNENPLHGKGKQAKKYQYMSVVFRMDLIFWCNILKMSVT